MTVLALGKHNYIIPNLIHDLLSLGRTAILGTLLDDARSSVVVGQLNKLALCLHMEHTKSEQCNK